MASATINLSKSVSSGTYIVGKIEWSSDADNNSNSSGVTAKLYVRKYNDGVTLTIPTSGKWSYSLTVNGSEISGSIRKDVLTDWVLIATKTVTVNHNNDGTKSITISGSVTAPTGTSLEGHKTTGSGTAKMDTVPRATTVEKLDCTTSYVDGTITAKYTPQNASYYNRRIIYLNQGGTLTTIRTADLGQKSVSQQTSTMNLSAAERSVIYSKVTDTSEVILRVTFRTYSDSGYSKKIGSDQYLEITLYIPESVAPTAKLEATMTTKNAWIAQKGIYVAGLTGAILKVTGTPGEGASNHLISINYSGNTYFQSTLEVSSFPSAGKYTNTATVIDTRLRMGTASNEINVLPYSTPAITSIEVERGTYDAVWTANETGPDVRVVYKTTLGLVAQGNTYSAAFKLDGVNKTLDYGSMSGLASGASQAAYFFDLSGESSYALTLTVTDQLGYSRATTVTIPTVNVTMEFRQNGKGVAFGKTAEIDGLDIGWNVYLRSDGQQSIAFDRASKSGLDVRLYKGDGTSATALGLWDQTNEKSVWQYRDDGKFWTLAPLVLYGGFAPITINANDDLNDIQTTGFYRCPKSADAATVANSPTAYAFSLLVEQHAGYKQTLTQYNVAAPSTFIRNYYDGTWGPWYKVGLTQV